VPDGEGKAGFNVVALDEGAGIVFECGELEIAVFCDERRDVEGLGGEANDSIVERRGRLGCHGGVRMDDKRGKTRVADLVGGVKEKIWNLKHG
jgi:hypothetical protein